MKKKKEPEKQQAIACGGDINSLLEEFKEVNPSYERLFSNKTQRDAMARLIKKHSPDKVKEMIGALVITNSKDFAPTIISPLELETKLGKLIAFVRREKSTINNGGKQFVI